MKLCECGCGGLAPISTYSCVKSGYVRGQPRRFVKGHNARRAGYDGRTPSRQYQLVRVDEDGRARYRCEHLVIAEAVLGRPLPDGAVIHHANADGSDNRKSNLVICQDQAYHMLLHKRMRARDACGHADWLPCVSCKRYDDPRNMYVRNRGTGRHRECHAADARRRRSERMQAERFSKEQTA